MINVVGVYKLVDGAVLPKKGTELAACYDIFACLHNRTVKFQGLPIPTDVVDFGTDNAHITLYKDEVALIPTGLIFMIPETHHLKFYSRSGHAWKNRVTILNQPAVIDADYTNESFVILQNETYEPKVITTGDAIAQCELCVNVPITFKAKTQYEFDNFVRNVNMISSRNGGLGSTGN